MLLANHVLHVVAPLQVINLLKSCTTRDEQLRIARISAMLVLLHC